MFQVVTDTATDIPNEVLEEKNIIAVPLTCVIDGKEHVFEDTRTFNSKEYYDNMRRGTLVTTSQVPPQRFVDRFEPIMQAGQDVLFIGMASGISGTNASAQMAADQLKEEYPQRSVVVVDSMGSSYGTGLMALRAAECRDGGMSLNDTVAIVTALRDRIYQVFTVDDLMYLKRSGRVSNATAIIGTVLGIKPILKGDHTGHIVAFDKIRGRRRSIAFLAKKYDDLVVEPERQTIYIAEADCKEDAAYLKDLLMRNRPPKDVVIVEYGAVNGAHTGPGGLALFFESENGVRLK